ncbi:hypothetical protein Sango_1725000 [Sesamum angolense]|uniref:Transposase n=1 Tax=Sesamum angolense TaxID=2727404 RepID=A0AAE1WLN0_9LAMI|nr:hypothetical protein Sango_1725000 [Sesamum angolense]
MQQHAHTIVEWQHKAFQQSTGSYVMGYVFWVFIPRIDGFQFCRKIISVDDTHLYTKYKHKLLIAAAMDGNQQGDVGCALLLIKVVREGPDFVSPHGVHRVSIKKVQPHYGRDKKQNVKAFAYLDQINKEKRTASHDGGWRCGILTTNMSECINGVLKGARRLPSEDYWDDPNFQLVHDPTIRISTRPGRNQATRIHNEMDWRQTQARQEAQQQEDSSIQENMSEEDC